MPKSKTAPFLVIIIAVLAAAGIAIYLSQKGSEGAESTEASNVATAAAPGSGRVRGAPDAQITLVEYGDYQCPTCGSYHPIITELLNRYAGKFKLEYHHFPLVSIHPYAMPAALAAEAAGEQGKFWEMHDLLYEHQREWGNVQNPHPNPEGLFLQYALQIGLDSNKFEQDRRSPTVRDRVLADVTRGNPIVKGTPTFVLDGQVLPNLPNLEWFIDYIERKLASSASATK